MAVTRAVHVLFWPSLHSDGWASDQLSNYTSSPACPNHPVRKLCELLSGVHLPFLVHYFWAATNSTAYFPYYSHTPFFSKKSHIRRCSNQAHDRYLSGTFQILWNVLKYPYSFFPLTRPYRNCYRHFYFLENSSPNPSPGRLHVINWLFTFYGLERKTKLLGILLLCDSMVWFPVHTGN